MKRKNILIKATVTAIIAVLITAIPVMTGFTTESGVQKNETVYIVLNHDGSIKDERVVNRVWGTDESSKWIDYGEYQQILNMISADEPEVEGNKIIWPMDILKAGSLYYQGVTDKDLPVEVSIRYYLDGKVIKGEELSGKTGNLKIKVKVINKLKQNQFISYMGYRNTQEERDEEYYVPLMVQVTLKLDLDIFSGISAEGATKVISGSEMNVGFGAYPYPEEEFTVEMRGKNIELEPINIAVVPQNIPFPDTGDTEESLVEMADGLEEIGDNTYKIVDGLNEMLNETDEFKNGIRQLADAIAEINHGAYELNNNSGNIGDGINNLIGGLDALESESGTLVSGINEIKQNTGTMSAGIKQLAGGASELSANITVLHNGMVSFQSGHQSLVTLAEAILAAYPDIPENAQIRTLAQGVIGENPAIGGFVSGTGMIDTGAANLSSGLNNLSNNFSVYSSGIDEIASGTSSLPEGIGQLADGMRSLYNGWREYSDGISELYNGTQEFYNETVNLPADTGELINGIKEIRNAIEELADKGIIEMEDGVAEGIDSIKFSKALEEKLGELAEGYNSFIDNDKNLNSEVQFIMQTEKIKTEESLTAERHAEPDSDLTFFQKILSWFKK